MQSIQIFHSANNQIYPLKLMTSFKQSSLKQRIQRQYLPRYCKKLKIDNKKLNKNEEDRLSLLTLKQIDRIIDMQKIKYVLNGKKNGEKQVYLQNFNVNQQQNKHPNVYRANFLAKINKIAIERNITPQKTLGFESVYGESNPQQVRRIELQKQRQSNKYIKYYRSNKKTYHNNRLGQMKKNKINFFMSFNYDQRQITEVQVNDNQLDMFQEKIKSNFNFHKKNSQLNINQNHLKSSHTSNGQRLNSKKLLSSNKWFEGMSTIYLEKKNFFEDQSEPAKKYRILDVSRSVEKVQNHEKQKKIYNIVSLRIKTEGSYKPKSFSSKSTYTSQFL